MRILYGVVGEGMGHATRSRVVIENLLNKGHEIYVVVSGNAYKFLNEAFAETENIQVEEIHGLSLSFSDNRVQKRASLIKNLRSAPSGIAQNIGAYRKLNRLPIKPQLVISDFDSWAYIYARNHRIPVISIDNMQIIDRCEHSVKTTNNDCTDFRLAQKAVKIKMPNAYHYIASSFFYPQVKKERTTLVPPILRPEILEAKPQAGKHILVYQSSSSNEQLVELLKKFPHEFRLYGFGREGRDANLIYRPFSQKGFIDDLRTARAVIAGGGYSLMGEAVHLGIPMLSVPIAGQYEQQMNAAYLRELGYGDWTASLSRSSLVSFINNIGKYKRSLKSYLRQDNSMLFRCLDELVEDIAAGRPAADFLASPSMGAYEPLRLCA